MNIYKIQRLLNSRLNQLRLFLDSSQSFFSFHINSTSHIHERILERSFIPEVGIKNTLFLLEYFIHNHLCLGLYKSASNLASARFQVQATLNNRTVAIVLSVFLKENKIYISLKTYIMDCEVPGKNIETINVDFAKRPF